MWLDENLTSSEKKIKSFKNPKIALSHISYTEQPIVLKMSKNLIQIDAKDLCHVKKHNDFKFVEIFGSECPMYCKFSTIFDMTLLRLIIFDAICSSHKIMKRNINLYIFFLVTNAWQTFNLNKRLVSTFKGRSSCCFVSKQVTLTEILN